MFGELSGTQPWSFKECSVEPEKGVLLNPSHLLSTSIGVDTRDHKLGFWGGSSRWKELDLCFHVKRENLYLEEVVCYGYKVYKIQVGMAWTLFELYMTLDSMILGVFFNLYDSMILYLTVYLNKS